MSSSSRLSDRLTDPACVAEARALEEEVTQLLHRTFELMDFLEDEVNRTIELESVIEQALEQDHGYRVLKTRLNAVEEELALIKGGRVMRLLYPLREFYIRWIAKQGGR